MPIVKKHSSGAPILAALVGGQGQRARDDQQRAQQMAMEAARLQEQARQFNVGTSVQQQQMAQRERMNKLGIAAQLHAQARSEAARARAQQVAGRQDLQRMQYQHGMNREAQMFNLAQQAQAQQARRGMLQDQNIWQANQSAMDSEANALLKHQFPSQEAFQQAWGQHNRKRQMMGLSPLSPPPWQQPPPDPKQIAWQQAKAAGFDFVPMDENGLPDFRNIKTVWENSEAGRKWKEEQEKAEHQRELDRQEEEYKLREKMELAKITEAAKHKPEPTAKTRRGQEIPVEYSEEGRMKFIMDRYEEDLERAAKDGFPSEGLTHEKRERWSNDYDMIFGKTKQPSPIEGVPTTGPQIFKPGTEEHKKIVATMPDPEHRAEAKGLTIVPVSEVEYYGPGKYVVLYPDGVTRILVKHTQPQKSRAPQTEVVRNQLMDGGI